MINPGMLGNLDEVKKRAGILPTEKGIGVVNSQLILSQFPLARQGP